MELIRHTSKCSIHGSYFVRMWYDDAEDSFTIRYHWETHTKKYTRSKTIAVPRSAFWYYSYSEHLCRQRIGIEEEDTKQRIVPQTLPKAFKPLPRSKSGSPIHLNGHTSESIKPQIIHLLHTLNNI